MRNWKFAAAAAALVVGLAGCGSNDSGGEPQAASSDAGPKFAGQTLTVWRLGDPAEINKKYMTDLNAKFKQQTGADVKVEWVPWPDAQAKWTAAVTAGSGPDVTELGNDQVSAWAGQSAIADLTEMVNGNAEFQQIPKNLWGYETIDDKIYAVPWAGGTRAVLYRKDWFKELNIEVPKTWDDLVAAAKKIVAAKGKDVDGFAFNGGADANMSLSPFVWAAGGDFATSEGGKWIGKLTERGLQGGLPVLHRPGLQGRGLAHVGSDAELRGHRHPVPEQQGRDVRHRPVGPGRDQGTQQGQDRRRPDGLLLDPGQGRHRGRTGLPGRQRHRRLEGRARTRSSRSST